MARYYLDVSGETCPQPLDLTQKQLAQLEPGDSLTVTSSFNLAVRNIVLWAEKQGYTYDMEEVADIWHIHITKN